MTGYGEAKGEYKDKQIRVDIRSLNGKISDVRVKAPSHYREKELVLRNRILAVAERGKIDVNINVESETGDESHTLNAVLFTRYFRQLSQLEQSLGYASSDLTGTIMRLPDVVKVAEVEVDEGEWNTVLEIVDTALEDFVAFRKQEGRALMEDMSERIRIISQCLEDTAPFEQERFDRLRAKLDKMINDNLNGDQIDTNRFEQEILYYLERLDINEEKVRLAQHCVYFIETLKTDESAVGRKLNFIAQEIGREINTLGAKAQHSDIQRLVVQMKDELEKLKEQVANTL